MSERKERYQVNGKPREWITTHDGMRGYEKPLPRRVSRKPGYIRERIKHPHRIVVPLWLRGISC